MPPRSGVIRRTITRVATALLRRYASGFDIAGGSGRWPHRAAMNSPVSQSLAARPLAATRVRWLSQNSALISAIISNAVTAIVADGPVVKPSHPDPAVNQELQDRWNEFAADSDISGGHTLGGYLSRVARGLFVDGESFSQMLVDPLAMRLKLRLLNAEQVDSSVVRPAVETYGPTVIAGVEHDALGRVTAYYVRPTAMDQPWASTTPPVRIDAADIAHVYEPHMPGLPRGISPLASVAGLALELDGVLDAAAVKLRASATLCMILKDVIDPRYVEADETFNPAALEMTPGQTLRLPPGLEPTFTPVSDFSSTPQLLEHLERAICGGVGLPYFMCTSDYGSINFSAGKLGMAAFQRRTKSIQSNLIVGQLLNKVWDRFVLLEVLSGRMRARDYEAASQNYRANFLWRAWPAIDELKSAKANTLSLAAKLKSRAELVAEGGRDLADLDVEIEADKLAPNLSVSASGIVSQVDQQESP